MRFNVFRPEGRILLLLAAVFLFVQGVSAHARTSRLTLLFTNDTHGHIRAFDFRGMSRVGGVAARASLINEIRQSNRERGVGTLLLDIGDVMMKDPMAAVFFGEPDVLAMNMMKYDAMGLGNHEFTVSRPRLTAFRARADFPLIATNVLVRRDRSYLVEPSLTMKQGDLLVHILATVIPETVKLVKSDNVSDLVFDDPVKAVSRTLPLLEAVKDPRTLVVVLVHDSSQCAMEISRIKGVDLVLAGHEHKVIQNDVPGSGAPIFSAGAYGLNLGRVDLSVDDRGQIEARSRMIPVGDPEVAALVASYEEKLGKIMGDRIGTSDAALSTRGCLEKETNLGNYIVDSYRSALASDVMILNSGVFGVVDIPAGSITIEDVFAMIPYDNLLEVRRVRGEVIRQALEWGLSRRGFNPFPHISGCRVTVSDSGELDITVNGRPLDLFAEYTLCSTDFLFGGGDGYEMLKKAAGSSEVLSSRYMRDGAITWLRGTGKIHSILDGRIPSAAIRIGEGADR